VVISGRRINWMKERNNVPTWDVFLEKVIILDTIEIGQPGVDLLRAF
jgi:hypothetical protein